MVSILATSLGGMQAAHTALAVSAHNVANLSTQGFRRQQGIQTADALGEVSASLRVAGREGHALEQELVDQLAAKNQFLANLMVFKTGDRMLGALLDATA